MDRPPASYDEVFRHYYSRVVVVVRGQGIREANVEDVAQEILAKFYQRDFLTEFNPRYGLEPGEPEPEPPVAARKFNNFLMGFVLNYVRSHRTRQWRSAVREPLLCDQPVGEDGTTWLELHEDGAAEPGYGALEERELVAFVRGFLSALRCSPRSTRDTCDVLAVFDELVEFHTNGDVEASRTAALASTFGISKTAAQSWTARTRADTAEAVAEYARRSS